MFIHPHNFSAPPPAAIIQKWIGGFSTCVQGHSISLRFVGGGTHWLVYPQLRYGVRCPLRLLSTILDKVSCNPSLALGLADFLLLCRAMLLHCPDNTPWDTGLACSLLPWAASSCSPSYSLEEGRLFLATQGSPPSAQ